MCLPATLLTFQLDITGMAVRNKESSHPPKWLECVLQQTQDTKPKEQMDSKSKNDNRST